MEIIRSIFSTILYSAYFSESLWDVTRDQRLNLYYIYEKKWISKHETVTLCHWRFRIFTRLPDSMLWLTFKSFLFQNRSYGRRMLNYELKKINWFVESFKCINIVFTWSQAWRHICHETLTHWKAKTFIRVSETRKKIGCVILVFVRKEKCKPLFSLTFKNKSRGMEEKTQVDNTSYSCRELRFSSQYLHC